MGKRWGSLIFCTILSTSIVSVTAKNAVQDLCKVFFRPMENQKWPPIISYKPKEIHYAVFGREKCHFQEIGKNVIVLHDLFAVKYKNDCVSQIIVCQNI